MFRQSSSSLIAVLFAAINLAVLVSEATSKTITVIDDFLTSLLELGTQNVGKAQREYVASSVRLECSDEMAFTAMTEKGVYGDSLNFFGVYRIGSTMSRLSVTGKTLWIVVWKNQSFSVFTLLLPVTQASHLCFCALSHSSRRVCSHQAAKLKVLNSFLHRTPNQKMAQRCPVAPHQ
ncbi:hypothetical protein H5410_029064 [Solanum commersonii]|uniref:Uncharacterized protein n=1 Tax=Solanum commersonii TaxID=4109 RepID=A0A9J5Z7Y7_SOLCO|nr:hypothetical protein H5410_029064 [Solanum commersonii]